jgi:hypothetical protein
MERIHAAKMAYITDRLHLTEEQSMRFIPLYNQYDREIRNTRQDYFSRSRGQQNYDNDEAAARQAVDDNLNYQQDVIEIKRRYNDLFLKVISAQQLADLYRSEREFKQILLQRIKQQRSGRFR